MAGARCRGGASGSLSRGASPEQSRAARPSCRGAETPGRGRRHRAGRVDVDDLGRARWANARKGECMGAAGFSTSHSVSYSDMTCNQARADADTSDAGAVPEAVRRIAVPIEVSEQLKRRMEGPADACAAAHERQNERND
ncbi:unnamed protein product [Prorocentrum cordatum]|uniref:Uncharacterized protein n=1 Tax=Prorocentrum cordatum TaxID=2364126 RepID=A0ABN9WUW3_9DINO|nr:unnamed protein product [Polarella glacialis]